MTRSCEGTLLYKEAAWQDGISWYFLPCPLTTPPWSSYPWTCSLTGSWRSSCPANILCPGETWFVNSPHVQPVTYVTWELQWRDLRTAITWPKNCSHVISGLQSRDLRTARTWPQDCTHVTSGLQSSDFRTAVTWPQYCSQVTSVL